MLLFCLADAAEPSKASLLFEQFARGEFLKDTRVQVVPGVGEIPLEQSGPKVEVEKGNVVHCSVLEYQALVVTREGPSAFDAAFSHLDDDRVYMRWIAAKALILITGQKPLWYWFGTPGTPFSGDANWSSRAKTTWLKWKAEQSGADKPATKPADKSPVKNQPLTPTSKGGPR